MSLAQQIAAETQLPERGVAAAVALFDDGATLPFVARYRKERTGGLDEVQLRSVLDARKRLTELAQRRDTILQTLKEQGQLTDALRRSLEQATRKSQIEDLYAPYKRGRATRGDNARKLGLEPLARQLLNEHRGHPSQSARAFVRGGVASTDEARRSVGGRAPGCRLGCPQASAPPHRRPRGPQDLEAGGRRRRHRRVPEEPPRPAARRPVRSAPGGRHRPRHPHGMQARRRLGDRRRARTRHLSVDTARERISLSMKGVPQ